MTAFPLTKAVLSRLREEAAFSGITGAWDGASAGHALTSGGCALFAAALAVTHGLPIVAVGQTECCRTTGTFGEVGPCCAIGDCAPYGDGRCCCHAHHFYVAVDGWLIDAYGEHDPAGVIEAYDGGRLYPWTDEALACLLETWHLGAAEDADLVILATDLADKPFGLIRLGLAADLEVSTVI